ncbi:MAG: hypothetical protein RIS29_1251 [Bacteroidota bacterium]|jgi:hypothetical protein
MRVFFVYLVFAILPYLLSAQVAERNSHLSIFNDYGLRYSPSASLLHASVVFKNQNQKLIQQQSNQKIKIDSVIGAHKKLYFTYSVTRRQVVCLTKVCSLEDSLFRTASKSEFNYDSFGNCTYEIMTDYSYSGALLSDSLQTKTAYIWGENGPLDITVYSFSNGGWEYSVKNEFTYKDGRLLEEVASSWMYNRWEPFGKFEYGYAGNGLLSVVQAFDKVGEDWMSTEKCESEYNRNQKLIALQYSKNDTLNERWLAVSKYSISYDTKGNIASEELELRDSLNTAWQLNSKTMYGYLDSNFKRGDIQNGDYVLGDFSSKHIMNQVQYGVYDQADKSWSLSPNETKLYYSLVQLSAKQVLDESGYNFFK